jgi:hypothetical protein
VSIPYDSRALICTSLVMAGIAALVTAELPGGLGGAGILGRAGGGPSGPGGGEQQRDERREIVEQVLGHEARVHAGRPVCLQTTSAGPPLQRDRVALDMLRSRLRERRDPRLQRAINRWPERYNWRMVQEPGERRAGAAAAPSPQASRILSQTAFQLTASPPEPAASISMEPAALPAPLRAAQEPCDAGLLTFSTPAIVANLAFVETDCRGTPACARRILYVLVRRDDRWHLQAETRTWTS